MENNIILQFEQEAQARLSKEANDVTITGVSVVKSLGKTTFGLHAILDGCPCIGKSDSIGKAIDECINFKVKEYTFDKERVTINDTFNKS